MNDESYLGTPDKNAKINRHVLNKRRRKMWWQYRTKIPYCNVASMSANKNENTPVSVDAESDSFIMDTVSADHVCKNRNLFVGNIVKCPEIDIKAFGGSLGAEGYGTIRLTIKDDHVKLHKMTVHNVLYLAIFIRLYFSIN